jgi:hypothetical protein
MLGTAGRSDDETAPRRMYAGIDDECTPATGRDALFRSEGLAKEKAPYVRIEVRKVAAHAFNRGRRKKQRRRRSANLSEQSLAFCSTPDAHGLYKGPRMRRKF